MIGNNKNYVSPKDNISDGTTAPRSYYSSCIVKPVTDGAERWMERLKNQPHADLRFSMCGCPHWTCKLPSVAHASCSVARGALELLAS
jgi:hypothetical protein